MYRMHREQERAGERAARVVDEPARQAEHERRRQRVQGDVDRVHRRGVQPEQRAVDPQAHQPQRPEQQISVAGAEEIAAEKLRQPPRGEERVVAHHRRVVEEELRAHRRPRRGDGGRCGDGGAPTAPTSQRRAPEIERLLVIHRTNHSRKPRRMPYMWTDVIKKRI